jgi:hypothetical protein
VTDVLSQSPGHEQALAARIFHFNRYAIASRVFDLKRHAIGQALTPRVFDLNHYATEQAVAPRVFHLNRRDPASKIFHLNHPVLWQSLADFPSFRQATVDLEAIPVPRPKADGDVRLRAVNETHRRRLTAFEALRGPGRHAL